MFKRLMVGLIVCTFLGALTLSGSQQPPKQKFDPKLMKKHLETAGTSLANIETILMAVEQTKLIRKDDGPNLDEEMGRSAESMMEAFKVVQNDLESASKTGQMQQEVVAQLKEFEDSGKGYAKRAENADKRLQDIEAKMRDADIELDVPVIESMTETEKDEYINFLSVRGAKKVMEKHPGRFKDVKLPKSSNDFSSGDRASVGSILTAVISLPVGILASFASPTYGMVAAGCYLTCKYSLGTLCIACITAAGSSAVAYLSQYYACRNSCCSCKWYRPWCCGCSTRCWAYFLAMIA